MGQSVVRAAVWAAFVLIGSATACLAKDDCDRLAGALGAQQKMKVDHREKDYIYFKGRPGQAMTVTCSDPFWSVDISDDGIPKRARLDNIAMAGQITTGVPSSAILEAIAACQSVASRSEDHVRDEDRPRFHIWCQFEPGDGEPYYRIAIDNKL